MHRTFQFAILLGAFLLFQVQPLIGRYILPWFGGSAGVWSVMMVFFQTLLLGGYCYAHVLHSRLRPRAQVLVHVLLLGVALAALPIVPSPALKPDAGTEPISRILLLLGSAVGLPYFVLSTTSPLLQAWFARSCPGRSPYRLYALGNAASLLALLSYPFLVEPLVGRYGQALSWSWGFGVFAVLCAVSGVFSLREPEKAPVLSAAPPARKKRKAVETVAGLTRPGMWIALSALGSTLLLAFTNELCLDVASVPFLWVLPLSCYLLSFVVTFSGYRAYRRGVWYPLAFAVMAGIAVLMFWPGRLELPLYLMVTIYAASLFVLCCALHGELYGLRPAPTNLTFFFVCVSLGGVFGGIFVGVVSPLVFNAFFELPLSLVASALLLMYIHAEELRYKKRKFKISYIYIILIFIYASYFGYNIYGGNKNIIYKTRNFYGTYVVTETDFSDGGDYRTLYSGTTEHGAQFIAQEYQVIPTQYYTRHSGIGIALASLSPKSQKIGVVGLGVGTLAAYGRTGDTFAFYEINPASLEIAQNYFTFLKNSSARIEVKLGDARQTLEKEDPQAFDMLILDAFTSDSIPVHLLTAEAFDLYQRHLKPGGVIAVHISNRHIDLGPVLKAVAEKLGMRAFGWEAGEGVGVLGSVSDYIFMTTSDDFIRDFLEFSEFARTNFTPKGVAPDSFTKGFSLAGIPRGRLWDDDYSNIFSVVKKSKRKKAR